MRLHIRAKNPDAHKAPWRKVAGRPEDMGFQNFRQLLECGHFYVGGFHRNRDAYKVKRRRCRACIGVKP